MLGTIYILYCLVRYLRDLSQPTGLVSSINDSLSLPDSNLHCSPVLKQDLPSTNRRFCAASRLAGEDVQERICLRQTNSLAQDVAAQRSHICTIGIPWICWHRFTGRFSFAFVAHNFTPLLGILVCVLVSW